MYCNLSLKLDSKTIFHRLYREVSLQITNVTGYWKQEGSKKNTKTHLLSGTFHSRVLTKAMMSHAEAHDRQLQQVFSHRPQSGEGITEPSRVGSIRGSPRLARKAVFDFLGGRSRGMGNCFLGLTSSHSPISPHPP